MAPEQEEGRWLDALTNAVGPPWSVDRVEAFDPAEVDVVAVAPPLRTPLSTFPNLLLIQSLWAGVEAVLRDPGLRTDLPLARMKDEAMEQSMQLSILSHVLAYHLHHDEYRRQQTEHTWNQIYGVRPSQRNITLLGLGAMSLPAAQMLAAVGFSVSALVRNPDRTRSIHSGDVELFGEDELDGRLRTTNVLVNVLPVTEETIDLVDGSLLARLPVGAAVVNVARGVHVVDQDLMAALDSGRLRHAFLDVFRTEPLPNDHPYWSHPGVTITPHMAAPTFPPTGAKFVAAQLVRLGAGEPLEHLVDHEAGY